MLLSVIIPTLNRHAGLFRQLLSLQRQTLTAFEIVVVDNAADADLALRLTAWNATALHPVRYMPEPVVGLMEARHTGARAATGDLLVYLDDDQDSPPTCLQAYAEAFAQHPEMAAAGGPLTLVFAETPPFWLARYVTEQLAVTRMCPMLGALDLGAAFVLHPPGWGLFFGGNVAIRRDVLFEVGGFNPELIGTRSVGDGEVGLYRKLCARGLRIGYVPDARQVHHVPPERMTLPYLRQRAAYDGPSDMYTRYHAHVPPWPTLLADALRLAWQHKRTWLAGLWHWGGLTPGAIDAQLGAVRAWAALRYLVRLMWDAELRALVEQERWLEVPVRRATPHGTFAQHGSDI